LDRPLLFERRLLSELLNQPHGKPTQETAPPRPSY
jgi:hypothetical protein